jgi:AraC-like DNA-binding protein
LTHTAALPATPPAADGMRCSQHAHAARSVQMDLISPLLAQVRTASPLIALMRLGGKAALAFPDNTCARILCVLDGACQVVIDGMATAVGAGDLVLFPRGKAHALRTEGAPAETSIVEHLRSHDLPIWTAARGLERPLLIDVGEVPLAATLLGGAIVFREPGAGMLLPHLPELIVFRHVSSEIADLTRLATAFIANIDGQVEEPGFSTVALRLLELLVIMALRRWLLDTPHQSGWLHGLRDPVVSRALRAMHRDPGRQWRVELLAREAGCSRTRFALRFHDVIGQSPYAYLTQLRIAIAKAQLGDTRRSVAQIAGDLGYSGAPALARAFSESVGQTPSEFRRNLTRRVETG